MPKRVLKHRIPFEKRPVNCVNVAEIARAVNQPHWRVWQLVRERQVPNFKFAGIIWVKVDDAKKFVEQTFGMEVDFDGVYLEVPTKRDKARVVVSAQQS